jgi:hypothetical protein
MPCGCRLGQGNLQPRLYQITKNFPGRLDEEWLLERGLYPGAETPVVVTPVDTVDPDHVLQGLEEHGWGRLGRVVWWFEYADEQM